MPKEKYSVVFSVGDVEQGADYSKEQIDLWTNQILFWIQQSQPSEQSPKEKAEAVMKAALNGTKLNGEPWPGIDSFSFAARIKQLCSWDIETGIGRSSNVSNKKKVYSKTSKEGMDQEKKRNNNEVTLLDLDTAQLLEKRDAYIKTLQDQYPWISSEVYETQVQALAEAVVRMETLSEDYLTAKPKELELLLKIKSEIRKDINELMDFLGIHPKQLKDKVDDNERSDVGSLIRRFEQYQLIAQDYEKVDAIQELIQMIRMSHNLRADGKAPQLADYMLWHLTGCRGHHFKCSCGKMWELYDGFTLEELEAAGDQAMRVFGFGIKKIVPPADPVVSEDPTS